MFKILIVDDDRDFCRGLSKFLRREGYRVNYESRPLRVYDYIKDTYEDLSGPDLIVLDLMMPYLDGWDILKLLSMDQNLKNIPALIVTADSTAFDGQGASVEVNVLGYVIKSKDKVRMFLEILERIRGILSEHRSS